MTPQACTSPPALLSTDMGLGQGEKRRRALETLRAARRTRGLGRGEKERRGALDRVLQRERARSSSESRRLGLRAGEIFAERG